MYARARTRETNRKKFRKGDKKKIWPTPENTASMAVKKTLFVFLFFFVSNDGQQKKGGCLGAHGGSVRQCAVTEMHEQQRRRRSRCPLAPDRASTAATMPRQWQREKERETYEFGRQRPRHQHKNRAHDGMVDRHVDHGGAGEGNQRLPRAAVSRATTTRGPRDCCNRSATRPAAGLLIGRHQVNCRPPKKRKTRQKRKLT